MLENSEVEYNLTLVCREPAEVSIWKGPLNLAPDMFGR